jgi:hypothetical protein
VLLMEYDEEIHLEYTKNASLYGKQRPFWLMAAFPCIGSDSTQMHSKSMEKHVEQSWEEKT